MGADDWYRLLEDHEYAIRDHLKEPNFLTGIIEPWRHPLKSMHNGHTINSKADGPGVYIYPDLSKVFLGLYREGRRHGRGVTIFTSRDEECWAEAWPNKPTRIVREYVDGEPSDSGRILWFENWYAGEIKNDKMHGHGIVVFGGGGRMAGEFKDGKMHGWGFNWDGDGVEGEWEDGNLMPPPVKVPCSECKRLWEDANNVEEGSGPT